MSTISIIVFFTVFIGIVIILSLHSNIIEKEILEMEEKAEENSKRFALELENTEFNYGHNITHKSDD